MGAENSSVPGQVTAPREATNPRATCGFWIRILALAIDCLILWTVGKLLGFFFFDTLVDLGGWGSLLGFSIALLYFGALNSSVGNGGTLGKKIVKLRVVNRQGEHIPPHKSFLRFAVLASPFFLNGALIPETPLLDTVVFLIVSGVGGGIIYLYVFNRRTRQSLHDLAVDTYVMPSAATGPVDVPAFWKKHLVVVAAWCAVVLILPIAIEPLVSRKVPLREFLSLEKAIESSGKTHVTGIFAQRTWEFRKTEETEETTTGLSVDVRWKTKPASLENAAAEVGAVILREYPEVYAKDYLTVSVEYGYDIGIAQSLQTSSTALSPANWVGNLATSYYVEGKDADAEILLERSLPILEKNRGPEAHDEVATSLNNLAMLYHTQGNYAEAERHYKRSLAIWEKALGPDHPQVATGLNNRAALYDSQRKLSQAERLLKRSLAIREKALGPDHPLLGLSLNNLARIYDEQGHYAQALPLYKRAIAIHEKAPGPNLGNDLNNLGKHYWEQGEYAQAEPLFRRALEIMEKALGPEHHNVANSLNNLAEMHRVQGNYAQAEQLYKRSLAIVEKALGPEHPAVAKPLENYAVLLREMKRDAEAEKMEVRAQAIRARHARENPTK